MGIIYKHTNIITGKSYIGRTIFSIEKRWKSHISSAKNGSTYDFHESIRKYGESNFISEILEECKESDIINREEYWIKYYDTYNNGYNMNEGGSGYGLLSLKSKEKFLKSINIIEDNGNTKAQNTYKKRNETLSKKDKNFFKNIGKKSSKTQKNNGLNKGNNNPNAKNQKVILMNEKGEIQDSFYRWDINNINPEYPKRMIIWSLENKKPMYTWNIRKDKEKFRLWVACYENEIFCNIDVKIRLNP
jgi:group I intron endonuclease